MADRASGPRLANGFALGGIALGGLATIVSEYYDLSRAHLGYAAMLGCVAYLGLRKLLEPSRCAASPPGWRRQPLPFIAFQIALLVLLVASSLISSRSLYERPHLYFGLVFASLLIMVVEIVSLDLNSSWRQAAFLTLLLLLGVSLKATAFFLYPTVSGNDPFVHQRYIEYALSTGRFRQDVDYGSFPLMHLIATAAGVITRSSSKEAMFSIAVLQSIGMLAIYSIGRDLSGVRTGIIAALFFSFSDYAIHWGIQVMPNGLGVVWLVMVLAVLVRRTVASKPGEKVGWTASLFLFLAAMLLTHTLSTLALVVALFTIAAAGAIGSRLSPTASHIPPVRWSLAGLFSIAVVTYWMNAFSVWSGDMFTRLVVTVRRALQTAEFGNVDIVTVAGELDPRTVFLGEAGWTLLIVCAAAGWLLVFGSLQTRRSWAAILTLLPVYSVVVYAFGVLGVADILPDRWLPFAYIPASLLAAEFLSALLTAARWRPLMSTLFVTLLSSILVLMATSPGKAIPDSPIYARDLAVRPGLFASEQRGMEHAKVAYEGLPLAASAKTRRVLETATIIDPRRPETYEDACVVVLGELDMTRGFFIPFPRGRINEWVYPGDQFLQYLAGDERLRVYDDGSIQLYLAAEYWETGVCPAAPSEPNAR